MLIEKGGGGGFWVLGIGCKRIGSVVDTLREGGVRGTEVLVNG